MDIQQPNAATTEITRTIEFKGCFHRGKSHIKDLELDTYYYCDTCREYRKINEIR